MIRQVDFAGRWLQRNAFQSAQRSVRLGRRYDARHFHGSFRCLKPKDFYETLGVSQDADDKAIKKAFFDQAKIYHPDKNPDDPNAGEKFSEVNEAYQTLSDKNKRAQYDMFGTANNGAGGGGPGGPDGFQGMDLNDIFENLFGGRGGRGGMPGGGQRQRDPRDFVHNEPGNDVQVEVNLEFKECFADVKRDLSMRSEEKCDPCQGNGMKAGTTPKTCPHCKGSGMMQRQSGFMIMQSTCPFCNGEGQSVEQCPTCHGHGLQYSKKTIQVTIPAGVDDGMRVRIPSQGGAARSQGPRGHLYLYCRVKAHRKFERDGADLHIQATLPLSMAVLGGEYELTLPSGTEIKHKVKAGTQPSQVDKIRGKGLPNPRTGMNGNLYIHHQVHIPAGLDDEQKKIMEQFKEQELFKDYRWDKPSKEAVKSGGPSSANRR